MVPEFLREYNPDVVIVMNLINSEETRNGLRPLGYLDFMTLEQKAKVMFTDSGGTQEETTILGIPCITLREKTERPVTVTEGTNVIVGNVPENIRKAFEGAISKKQIEKKVPRLWDGKTAERIINILISGCDQGIN